MEAEFAIRAVVAALATHYWTFVFQRKAGPFDCFLRARRWMRRALPPPLAQHLLCPTCTALSVGLLFFGLSHLFFPLVIALAMPGFVMLVGGMSGHPHFPDAPDED